MAMPIPIAQRRFTVDEYHRMAEAGILTEDDRVELLDGQIVPMSPISPKHAGCVKYLTAVLARSGHDVLVGVQDPVVLDPHWEPQPDVAVLRSRPDAYRTEHPGPRDVLLVIEVAETSASFDRSVKIPGYARAGIAESWLVNLPDDCIEVFRDPGPAGYRSVHTAQRGETLKPLLLPGLEIKVEDVLG